VTKCHLVLKHYSKRLSRFLSSRLKSLFTSMTLRMKCLLREGFGSSVFQMAPQTHFRSYYPNSDGKCRDTIAPHSRDFRTQRSRDIAALLESDAGAAAIGCGCDWVLIGQPSDPRGLPECVSVCQLFMQFFIISKPEQQLQQPA